MFGTVVRQCYKMLNCSTEAVVSVSQSAVDTAFWSELGLLKLNTLRLSEEPVTIYGALKFCLYMA